MKSKFPYRVSCCVLVLLAWGLVKPAPAQLAVPDELAPALRKIDEDNVTRTIRFLASDEMAGRDTPSPQLTKAAQYVAERFKAAGLRGGGVDGSFFQPSQIETIAYDPEEIVFEREGNRLPHFGMLATGTEKHEFSGPIKLLDTTEGDSELPRAVAVKVPEFKDRRQQFMFSQSLGSLTRRGADLVILLAAASSPIAGEARKNAQPRLANSRQRFRGPILVVPATTELRGRIDIKLPATKFGKATVRNVIGVVRGSDPELSKQAIVVSAHLDHIGTTPGLDDSIFNGADDNATGVTGVVTMADAFAALRPGPKRSVIFMTFWGEEKGLLGSRYFCDNPTWPLEDIVANVNLEMIGRPEGGANEKAWMTGWDKSDLGTLMAEGAGQLKVEIFEHPRFSDMLYGASDNISFARKGVVAHSFSAGSLHEDYHQPGDHWEKLNLRHMTRVIQGLFAGVNYLATGEVTPKPAG